MMNKYSKLLLTLAFLCVSTLCIAQIPFDKKQHRIMLKTMDSIFALGFKNNVLKDSIAIYAINFELDIIKVNNGTEVKHINTNDKLGYILFPSFKRLYSINFSSLMGTQQKITLRIPILIINSSVEKRVYKQEDGSALIDLKAASNASYALTSNVPYDNIKQSEMNFQLESYYTRNPEIERFKNIILLNPYFIEILNIPKK